MEKCYLNDEVIAPVSLAVINENKFDILMRFFNHLKTDSNNMKMFSSTVI